MAGVSAAAVGPLHEPAEFPVSRCSAAAGVTVFGCDPSFKTCAFTRNTVGASVGKYDSVKEHPVFQDCAFALNAGDGVAMSGAAATFESVTVSRNGGWGISGAYYASPDLRRSVVTGNKLGGVWCKLYDCEAVAHDSVICDNGAVDVKNESSRDWDFTRNYSGRAATKALKSKVASAAGPPTVRNGKGGRVRIGDYLDAPPEGVGSSITKVGRANVR